MENLVPLLTTHRGEINQRDYWIGAAALFVAGIVANMIPLIGAVAALLLLYPWTCLVLKRLRDAGRPESWAALPLLLGLFSMASSLMAAFGLFVAPALAGLLLSIGGLAALAALGFLVWLGLAPSRHALTSGM